ncbi:alpha/beta fold hydrolase [Pseudomonas sp. L7]|uniref:alpha/beta fold hydrolase n=1 Tax=Pseudomonas sp. L7 TaxID=3388343 RepID=UPI0039851377
MKNIVLVHGLFADASSWSKVIPLLQAKGLHVTAVQNPTTSLDDDVAAVNRALAQQDGPVILVGHSYGGMVISQAGDAEKVKGLVYIAARAPEAGEDYPALTKRFPAAPAGAGLQWSADGYGMLSENAFVNDFAGDLRLDLGKHRCERAGIRIDLTSKEFKLLACFLQHPEQVLSRTFLASRVWDMNFDSDTNVVDVAVRRLRQKVDEPFAVRLIHTVHGVGYRCELEA